MDVRIAEAATITARGRTAGASHGVPEVVAPVRRPRRSNDMPRAAGYHAAALVVAVGVLLMAATATVHDGRFVVLPWLDFTLPDLCWWRRLLQIECPGCGLTRSLVCAVHGRWKLAVGFHPGGIVVLAGLVGQLPYRSLQLARIASGRPSLGGRWLRVTGWGLMLAVLAGWLARVVATAG